MKIRRYQFHSFAQRLSIYASLVVIVVFSSILAVYYYYTKTIVMDGMLKRVQPTMKTVAIQIGDQLNNAEIALRNNEWEIDPEWYHHPDSLLSAILGMSKNLLTKNSNIIGTAVAFVPYYFPERGERFVLYSYRNQGEVVSRTFTDKSYDYLNMDWYNSPIQKNHDVWTEPYYDTNGGDMMMITYSHLLRDSKGKLMGIFSADISLNRLTQFVESLKPLGEESFAFLLSPQGYYLGSVDSDKIVDKTFFTPDLKQVAKKHATDLQNIMEGGSGSLTYTKEGKTYYVFYTSIPALNWSICSVVPAQYLLKDLHSTTRLTILLFLIGVVLIAFLSYKIISKLTQPITGFSAAAKEIAEGNFETELPEVVAKDEFHTLHDSLDYMRHALKNYINELQITTANKERMEKELSIAHNIQMGMLPKIFPPFPERHDIDLQAILQPAKEVGGDLYDFFIRDNKLYFAIGDVSGKGVPASLFMAITSSLFRTLLQMESEPENVMKAMNASLCENNQSNMFVTMIIGILNLKNGKLSLCNAGHNPPVLFNRNGVQFVTLKRNIPVATIDKFNYQHDILHLEPGDKLMLYTDGVTEAENTQQELYGETRLLSLLGTHAQEDVRALTDTVMEEIAQYTQGADQSDDITILTILYQKS